MWNLDLGLPIWWKYLIRLRYLKLISQIRYPIPCEKRFLEGDTPVSDSGSAPSFVKQILKISANFNIFVKLILSLVWSFFGISNFPEVWVWYWKYHRQWKWDHPFFALISSCQRADDDQTDDVLLTRLWDCCEGVIRVIFMEIL